MAKSIDGWVEEEARGKGRRSSEERRKGPLCSIYLWNPCYQQPREIFDPDSVDIPRGSKIGYIYRIQGGIATSETMGRHKFIIFSETNLIRRLYLISKKKNGEIYSSWSIDKLLFLARNLKLIFHKYIS